MIQPISLNTLKKGAVCAMLIGSAGLCSAKNIQPSAKSVSDSAQIISKAGADALRKNVLNLNIMNIHDSNTTDYTKYEYDSDGKLIKEYEYDENNNLICCYSYEYYPDGSNKQDTKYYADGKIEYVRNYYYHFDGTKTEKTVYDDNVKWIRNYDAEDYETLSIIYKPDGTIEYTYIYTWDDYGNRVETIYDSEGNIVK